MKEARKTINAREKYRLAIAEAMPEVKELVKKFGLTRVNSCLIKLRDYDKKARQAAKLREEADELERELSDTPAKLRGVG